MLIPNLATKFVSLTSKAFKMAFWPLFFPLDKLMGFFSSKFLIHCFLDLFFLPIPILAMKLGSLAFKAFKKASTCGGRSPPPTQMTFLQGKYMPFHEFNLPLELHGTVQDLNKGHLNALKAAQFAAFA